MNKKAAPEKRPNFALKLFARIDVGYCITSA